MHLNGGFIIADANIGQDRDTGMRIYIAVGNACVNEENYTFVFPPASFQPNIGLWISNYASLPQQHVFPFVYTRHLVHR